MSDPRTILAGVRERFVESLKDASHVVMFENMEAALADNPVMVAALTAVLDLHQPELHCNNAGHTSPDVECPECAEYCTADAEQYPCPTTTAITAALDADTTTREE